MPGIESYGRGKRTAGGAKAVVRPDELALILFTKVSSDAATFLDSYYDDFKSCPTFRPIDFERQKFTYLVAGVAIALTDAAEKENAILEVITAFRATVRPAACTRNGSTLTGIVKSAIGMRDGWQSWSRSLRQQVKQASDSKIAPPAR
jgi:hypothetical protein